MLKICLSDKCPLPTRNRIGFYCPEHYFKLLHLACLQFRYTWYRPDLYLGIYGYGLKNERIDFDE